MRLIRLSCGVVAWSCLVSVQALASQRGAHPTPHPPASVTPHSTPAPTPTPIVIKPALAARLQPLLPHGTTVQTAASGFRNQGQFVAAVHVAHNLNIPFAQLKTEITGPGHDSLGQAIHELRPTVNAKTAATRAEHEADEDLNASKAPTPTKTKGD